MNRFASVSLIAALLGPACTSEDAAPPELQLRDGFVLVHATEKPFRETLPDARQRGAFFRVDDVSIAAGRIILSGAYLEWSAQFGSAGGDDGCGCNPFAGGGSATAGSSRTKQYFYVSADEGSTWVRREVLPANPGVEVVHTTGLGVAEWGDHAAVVVAMPPPDSGMPGATHIPLVSQMAPLDLATDTFGEPNVYGTTEAQWSLSSGRTYFSFESQHRTYLQTFDIATGAMIVGSLDRYDPLTDCQAEHYRLIGDHFYALCTHLVNDTPVEQCLHVVDSLSVRPSAQAPVVVFDHAERRGCVPVAEVDPDLWRQVPLSLNRNDHLIDIGGGLFSAYETTSGDVVLAGRNRANGYVLDPIDLGPGHLWKGPKGHDDWYGLHLRYPRIIALTDRPDGEGDDPNRFIQVPADLGAAPIELAVPDPCVDGAACRGRYTVRAIQPLGAEQLLVVYDLRLEHQYTVVTRIPNPAYTPPTPVGASTPGGALERQCARLWSCFRSPDTDFGTCLAYWSRLRTGDGVADEAYAAFLATPAGCDAFAQNYRGALAATSTPCTPGCHGPMAVQCSEDGRSVRDCREDGVACRVRSDGAGVCGPETTCGAEVARCEDDVSITCAGEPVVRDCAALGLACDPATPATCQPATACAATDTCDGSVRVGANCADREDCDRVGLPCDAARASCGQADCHTELHCDGDRLTYCVGGAMRTIDCTSIGFRTCARELPYGTWGCIQ